MPYPTKDYIRSLLDSVEHGDGSAFWSQVAPDVDWTVMGASPPAGRYLSLDECMQATYHKLQKFIDGQLKLSIRHLLVDGLWSTLELEARGVCKNGRQYVNAYALIMRWSEEGKVVEVRDYLDTALIKEVWEENEGKGANSA
ncbi:hypothetical protein F5884DRAFT_860703 [Xylogone sp. PMI_703]|nr:hypothetical protein F5884DRAFT_860703 [Xylogone sp. PMI_703]